MSNARAASERLHERARGFVRAFVGDRAMPEAFDALACDIARFQAANVAGYAKLCSARGVDPHGLRRSADAPAVPTEAFRLTRVSAFPEEETPFVFRTSGTTANALSGPRGSHPLRDIATYDEAAVAFGRWALAHDLKEPVVVLALAPPPSEATESSLSHMLELFTRAFGGSSSKAPPRAFFVQDSILDMAGLDERVASALVHDKPVLLLATSFALVHFLEALNDASFRLPRSSRVMQTGGFKGRSREVDAPKLRRELAAAFFIDERHIVSEYGMTELSSQFYETTLRPDGAHHGVYAEPPWARVVPVDPETLEPVAEGQVGIARIEDLLNVDSAFAVLASDRVRRVPGGFELLGRSAGAPPRGCSIAVDELLGGPEAE